MASAIVQKILFEYSGHILKYLFIGFAFGVATVVLIRRRQLMPRRDGAYRWLNRFYYFVIIGAFMTAFAGFATINKTKVQLCEGALFLLHPMEKSIDSLGDELSKGKEELAKQTELLEANLSEKLSFPLAQLHDKADVVAVASHYLHDKIKFYVVQDVAWILNDWVESKARLSTTLNKWTVKKIGHLISPYYITVGVIVLMMIFIPVVELIIWKLRQRQSTSATTSTIDQL